STDFANTLASRQTEPHNPANVSPKIVEVVPNSPNLRIAQHTSSRLADRWPTQSINRAVVKIATGNRPTDHCADIFKYSPCRYGRIGELCVDHSGNVSAVKLIKRHMTNDGQHISAQSPLNLRP